MAFIALSAIASLVLIFALMTSVTGDYKLIPIKISRVARVAISLAMPAFKRELGLFVIEDRFLPLFGAVAFFTELAIAPLVHVLEFMADITIGDLKMADFFPVLENRLFPTFGVVAFIA